jgi:hypothetical protein
MIYNLESMATGDTLGADHCTPTCPINLSESCGCGATVRGLLSKLKLAPFPHLHAHVNQGQCDFLTATSSLPALTHFSHRVSPLRVSAIAEMAINACASSWCASRRRGHPRDQVQASRRLRYRMLADQQCWREHPTDPASRTQCCPGYSYRAEGNRRPGSHRRKCRWRRTQDRSLSLQIGDGPPD